MQQRREKLDPRWLIFAAGGLIAGAALWAYRDSFSGPFVFDDLTSVAQNATIRHLWPIWPVLNPPADGGLTVGGRPMVNLSLAMNYALGGDGVWGYHAFNLGIHILAGLTLFGVVRRTLGRWSALSPTRWPADGVAQRVGDNALHPIFFAFAVSLLWTLHPLQTESVTYVVQRTESLMGLFYLQTIYCFVRAVEAEGETEARRPPLRGGSRLASASLWSVLSFLACLCGMATKEVMVSAPLMVLLYDRTFVAGSFRESWRRRRRLYLALASTWIVLGFLLIASGGRGGTAGLGVGPAARWHYALAQSSAIVRYLRLSIWPHPLVFDYGPSFTPSAWESWLSCLVLLALLVGTGWALFGRPAERAGLRLRPGGFGGRDLGFTEVSGFAGAWFFLILAPTSSVVPVATQVIAEHRMYLPLAAVAVLVAAGLQAVLGRWSAPVVLALAVALGIASARRNEDYRSPQALWQATATDWPVNARAQYNLGDALVDAHQLPAAIAAYERALRLEPNYFSARYNLAKALSDAGRLFEGIDSYELAAHLVPGDAAVRYELGIALGRAGRWPEAVVANREAVRLAPGFAEAHSNLGNTLLQVGEVPEAVTQLKQALRLQPDFPEACNNLGNALRLAGSTAEAIAAYEEAVRLKPDYADACYNLGNALIRAGRNREAITQFERVLELKPDFAEARRRLAFALGAAAASP